jgi:hypothetical protein
MLGVLTSIDEGGPTMQAECDGRQIVGIDLHRHRTVIVRMTEAGDQLGCVRIDNDPTEIAKAGEHPDVVLEATYGWYWAADVEGRRRRGPSRASARGEGVRPRRAANRQAMQAS